MGRRPKPQTSTELARSLCQRRDTWEARDYGGYVIGEIVWGWARLHFPQPDWWMIDQHQRERKAFDEQEEAALLHELGVRILRETWPSDHAELKERAEQLAVEVARDRGVPAEVIESAFVHSCSPRVEPPVGDISAQVAQVAGAVEELTTFEQRAVLLQAARQLGLKLK